MNFTRHSDLIGQHSFLSASKHSWVNYDEDKLVATYLKHLATEKGTELHALAEQLIRLKIKLPKSKQTLNSFVNDAIGFMMTPEQPLFYSANSFGTPDAISFRDNFLRIHDLKTGVSRVSMDQLEIYAALFCLEYKVEPRRIETELRIYQSDQIIVHNPEWKDIRVIMDKIISFDKILNSIQNQED